MSRHIIDRTHYFLSHCDKGYVLSGSEQAELEYLIGEHNRRYYVDSSPIVSDSEYDQLYKMFVSSHGGDREYVDNLFERFRTLLSRQFAKGSHMEPMISLANTYDQGDLEDFSQRIRNIVGEDVSLGVIAELKLDGLGLSLLYEQGDLVRALTRGNGREGEDVTVNIQGLHGVPSKIPYLDTIEIRGEIIFPKQSFEELNKERARSGEKLFANPRNAASGTLRQLDTLQAKERGLEFYAYASEISKVDIPIDRSYQGLLSLFQSWGFHISPYAQFFESIQDFADVCLELARLKDQFDFEIDGLVIKLNDLSLWSTLGLTAHHPRYAIAYKFPTQEASTRLCAVEHSIGRSGIITPVALLEPVSLGGVTIARATLHNYDEVALKDVRIGDQIFIKRAGEVIPDVVAPIIEARTGQEMPIMPPERCPSCDHMLMREEGKVAVFCPNRLECPAQRLGMLETFVSKHAANIEGLGVKILEILYEQGFLTDIASLYRLSSFRDSMMSLEGFGAKKIDNILSEIDRARTLPVDRFLIALAIPLVGRRSAQTLSLYLVEQGIRETKDFRLFLERITTPEIQDGLLLIPDLGPHTLRSFVQFFEEHGELVDDLLSEISLTFPLSSQKIPSEQEMSMISGKTFCVTGSFDEVSREDIHGWIESHGGLVRTSVTKDLDYLIVGERAGSKAEKAEKLGVAMISLQELYDLQTK